MGNTKFVLDHDKRNAVKEVDDPPDKIGEVPANKIPIIDRHGIMRGAHGPRSRRSYGPPRRITCQRGEARKVQGPRRMD